MIRKQRSGNVIEKMQFWAGVKRPRKGRRKGSSSQKKKDNNLQQANRSLARILNCNFNNKDLFITLSYAEEHLPGCLQDALKLYGLFLRRLKRQLAKSGVSIRCVWITADKDLKGNPKRLHHHMVLGGEGLERSWTDKGLDIRVAGRSIQDIWKYGIAYSKPLDDQLDYTSLATYMVQQAASGEDVKKWHVSQGLDQPVILSEEIIDKPKELRAPAGAEVMEISAYDKESGSQYIRYIQPQKPERRYIGFDWIKGHGDDLLPSKEDTA